MLELNGLHKRFGDVVALDGVSFRVPKGSITGFLGRNGAGKSTAMRSIFGLLNLDAGQVSWNDQPVDAEATQRFGYMPEQRGLYKKMAIAAQVSWFAQIKGVDRAEADRSAKELLTGLGLEDRLSDNLEDLSHGNQQRVQLATALAHDPELCVLDEPFNGLDPAAVEVLNGQLRTLADRGRAVLFSSHQLDLVETLCDQVVIIEAGVVRLAGTVNEVRQTMGYHTLSVAYDAAPDWSQLAGYDLIVTGTRSAQLRLEAAQNLGDLAAQAHSAGSLTTFNFDLPSLSDVFIEVTK